MFFRALECGDVLYLHGAGPGLMRSNGLNTARAVVEDVRMDHHSGPALVPGQFLHRADVIPCREQLGGESVPPTPRPA